MRALGERLPEVVVRPRVVRPKEEGAVGCGDGTHVAGVRAAAGGGGRWRDVGRGAAMGTWGVPGPSTSGDGSDAGRGALRVRALRRGPRRAARLAAQAELHRLARARPQQADLPGRKWGVGGWASAGWGVAGGGRLLGLGRALLAADGQARRAGGGGGCGAAQRGARAGRTSACIASAGCGLSAMRASCRPRRRAAFGERRVAVLLKQASIASHPPPSHVAWASGLGALLLA